MGCVDENAAVALVEGRLSAAETKRVHEHVADCDACRQLVAALARAPTLAGADGDTPELAATLTDPAAEAAEATGRRERIGRYRVLEKMGEGGMGAVWAAEDPSLDRHVAIKVLHSGGGTERLLREARAMARLRHPNVVTVYEVGRDGDDVFIAMELIEGITLRRWLEGDPPWRERLAMLAQAGAGLAAAHREGLVHRDFKPDNVMVGEDGRAQVLDFGLAKAVAEPSPSAATSVPGGPVDLTRSGALVGTPAYMAPEQLARSRADERSDQFSFCVALHEALFGVRPFAGDTLEALIEAVTSGRRVEPPAEPRLPEDLSRALARGLSIDPADRFEDMEALLAAVEPRERARRRALPYLAAALAAAAAVAWLAGPWRAGGSALAPAVDPEAAILSDSTLPEPLDQPLPDDPLRVTVHRLSNGLTVYISPNHQKPRISTELIIGAGARDNPEGAGGLAHMVEHMMFKGTEHLGTRDFAAESVHLDAIRRLYAARAAAASKSERARLLTKIDAETVAASRFAIPKELTATANLLGVEGINGFTSQDMTAFVADVPSYRFEQWARLEGERWTHPVFRLFHAEIGTIYNEKRSSDAASVWAGKLTRALYGALFAGHPYARPTSGSYQDILSEPFTQLRAFFDRWYVPNNAALLLAGDIDPERAVDVLERELGGWKPRPLPPRPPRPPPPLAGPRQLSIASESERMVVVAWRTAPQGSPDDDALTVMTQLFRSGDGFAGDLGDARIRVWSQQLIEGGLFAVAASPGPDQSLDEMLAAIDHVVATARTHPVDRATLDAVIQDYRVGQTLALEGNRSRLAPMASAYLTHESWPRAAGWQDRLAAVEPGDVARVARAYLTPKRVVVRIEPGAAGSPPPPPPHHISPLELEAGGPSRSRFARELLAADAVELPLRFVWRGRDYEVERGDAGPIVAVRNKSNDLFAVELRWNLGSRARPLLCAALAALEDAGAGPLGPLERKRRWHARAMEVSTDCRADSTRITLSGIDGSFEKSWAALQAWLAGDGLTEPIWTRARSRRLDGRRRWRAQSAGLIGAVDQLASRGAASDYLALPHSATLAAASAAAARRALDTLAKTRHATLYFGPRDVAGLPGEAGAREAPPRRPPLRYLEPERPRLALLDTGRSKVIDVVVRVPLGPIDEGDVAVAQTFSTYLSDGMVGRLPETLREATGLSYAVEGGVDVPERPGDDASLRVRFSVDPAQATGALERALAVVRDAAIDEGRFESARRRTEARYRSRWISPRELPRTIDDWRRRGLEADPRPARFTRLGRLVRGDLEAFAARVARAPVIASLAGDISRLDRHRLERLGDVEVVKRGQLLPP